MASVCFFYTTYFRGDWKCISESCTSVLCSTWLTQVLCHYALGAQACLNSRRSEVGWKMQHLDNVIKISELMGWGGVGGGGDCGWLRVSLTQIKKQSMPNINVIPLEY